MIVKRIAIVLIHDDSIAFEDNILFQDSKLRDILKRVL